MQLKFENHEFRGRHMERIMGDNDSNSSASFSCDKPRYQVKVKCQ